MLGVVVLTALAAAAPAGAATPTRYSLANGCYSVKDAATGQALPGAEQIRMQATDLGSYLLYRPDRTFLAATGSGAIAPAARPSPAADWRVADAGPGTFAITPIAGPGGATRRVTFTPAGGCAVYPEAALDASGTTAKGATPYSAVGGLLEGHMHWMTFEYFGGDFHCGRPWHRYGIPYALPDCSEIEGPSGLAAPIQNFLNFGQPAAPHDTTGWPKLTEWSNHNLTYEGTYWKWVERAWLGGLRLMVMGINENRILCELQTRRRNSCDEMTTVRKGFAGIREMQRYVDAQAGGPGKGFFQIVTTPEDARRVINQGKMAVVLEVEISELFGCRGWEHPNCTKADVDRGIDELHRMGVRSSLFLNKVDNPLAGVRFDSGPVGILINAANRGSAGSFFSAETCTGDEADNEITALPLGPELDGLIGALGVTRGSIPAYPKAPHCNTRGLTTLGRHLARRMMEKGMIINPDHMSQKAVEDTLSILEADDYSGVISPHGWMDPGNWPRLWKLGGLAFPSASGAATNYVKEYQRYRPRQAPYKIGWGYGADLGGLAGQPEAPAAGSKGNVTYPFKSPDGRVTLERQRTGERTFDYSREGVAHYGMYADFFQHARNLGGEKLARDMWEGSEAYLQMWERADGVPAKGCRSGPAKVGAKGLGGIRLGRRWETLLRRVGQPQARTRAWTWCVRGKRNKRAADVAELDVKGKVELVASTARGRSARGIAVGSSSRRLRGVARPVGAGIHVRRVGKAYYVYSAKSGKVRAVGATTRSLARSRKKLRAAFKRALAARAGQPSRAFIPASASAAQLRGRPLVGTENARLNRRLELLCSLKG